MAARQYWSAPIPPMAASDGPAGTLAALQDISPLPQRDLGRIALEVGSFLRFRATGQVTSTSATPTLTLGFYLGTVGSISSSVVLGTASALPVTATTTAWPWIMELFGEIRALGSSGLFQCNGSIKWPSALTTYQASDVAIPATAAGRQVTVNLATTAQLMIGATWSSTTGTPSITCNHVAAEVCG